MLKSNKNEGKYIYLDYAAGVSANPSSMHSAGIKEKIKLQNARKKVAEILERRPEEIIFTSGGTESNNLAIQGIISAWPGKELPHIITTNIEHPSVLETFKLMSKKKLAQISIVPVEADGIIDPKKIRREIKHNTLFVSVMYANNEIGTIQPIKEIAKEIRHYKKQNKKNNIFFHTDAAQAANYLDLNTERLGVDLLSLSGSKIPSAGRVGMLYKKKSAPLKNIFGGGDQEMGFRPGTENLAEIMKFARALKFAQRIREKEAKRLTKLRDYFFARISKTSLGILINGDLKNRLPNNINITVPNIPSDLLVIELSARGIMASAKSACKAGDGKASYVVKAIRSKTKEANFFRRDNAEEDGSLRFSLGGQTTKKDIDRAVQALGKILTKLKKWYN